MAERQTFAEALAQRVRVDDMAEAPPLRSVSFDRNRLLVIVDLGGEVGCVGFGERGPTFWQGQLLRNARTARDFAFWARDVLTVKALERVAADAAAGRVEVHSRIGDLLSPPQRLDADLVAQIKWSPDLLSGNGKLRNGTELFSLTVAVAQQPVSLLRARRLKPPTLAEKQKEELVDRMHNELNARTVTSARAAAALVLGLRDPKDNENGVHVLCGYYRNKYELKP